MLEKSSISEIKGMQNIILWWSRSPAGNPGSPLFEKPLLEQAKIVMIYDSRNESG
jgi:hypothetical protein